MTVSKSELEEEKKYLSVVKKVIKRLIQETDKFVNKRKEDLNDLKKFMWDQITDYTDEERAMALYDMDKNVNLTNKRIDDISKYKKVIDSPYFAKIVFKDDLDKETIPIYIGITTVQDEMDFYVFDWRSPISSMFYNYEVGKAMYDSPNGKVTGEVLAKMQFKIENGKILRCIKSDINIDDDYLQEILASSRAEKMTNIVNTIQREQNEIIRNDSDKYLIVQGIAGSGKTSVALHRIAYLLYREQNLNYNNILIFSPNDVFSDYISEVLPELGEDNVMKSTFSEFSESFLKSYKNIENYAEFLERTYNSNLDRDLVEYKMSNDYKIDIDRFLENYELNIKFDSDLSYNNIKLSKDEIKSLMHDKYQKFPLNERLDLISENICNSFRIPKKNGVKGIKKILIEKSNIELDYMNLYKQFITSKYFKLNNQTSFSTKKINYEDIPGLLYINFFINDYPSYYNIKQVVIDEVQDYTKFQIELLKNIFKQASFTVLGDINQSINRNYSYKNLSELNKIFKQASYLELNKSYRSSEEIINYSNKILNINHICSVRRENNIPVEIKDLNEEQTERKLEESIAKMLKQNIKKIAIITKNIKAAKKISKTLTKKSLDIQLILSSFDALKKDIVIIPSYLAKGLEFDGVIIYNDYKDDYNNEEKKLYYVVCTRAQHKLVIYNEPLFLK